MRERSGGRGGGRTDERVFICFREDVYFSFSGLSCFCFCLRFATVHIEPRKNNAARAMCRVQWTLHSIYGEFNCGCCFVDVIFETM